MSLHSGSMHKHNKIKRSDLVDQLRDNQIRSKLDWASVSLISSMADYSSSYSSKRWCLSNTKKLLIRPTLLNNTLTLAYLLFQAALTSNRMDMMMFVFWELLILSFVVSSVVALHFSHLKLMLILATIASLLLVCMKVTKQVKLNQKKKRRMLLPLSM